LIHSKTVSGQHEQHFVRQPMFILHTYMLDTRRSYHVLQYFVVEGEWARSSSSNLELILVTLTHLLNICSKLASSRVSLWNHIFQGKDLVKNLLVKRNVSKLHVNLTHLKHYSKVGYDKLCITRSNIQHYQTNKITHTHTNMHTNCLDTHHLPASNMNKLKCYSHLIKFQQKKSDKPL
jgi:hypothetical protein